MKIKITDRINNYLGNGGNFNPELMEHDKVRDLLMDCVDELNKIKVVIPDTIKYEVNHLGYVPYFEKYCLDNEHCVKCKAMKVLENL